MPKYFIFVFAYFISICTFAQNDFIKVNSSHYVNFAHALVLSKTGGKYTLMYFDRKGEYSLSEHSMESNPNVEKNITSYLVKHANWVKVEAPYYIKNSEVYINLNFVENIQKSQDNNKWILRMGYTRNQFLLPVTEDEKMLDYIVK